MDLFIEDEFDAGEQDLQEQMEVGEVADQDWVGEVAGVAAC